MTEREIIEQANLIDSLSKALENAYNEKRDLVKRVRELPINSPEFNKLSNEVKILNSNMQQINLRRNIARTKLI